MRRRLVLQRRQDRRGRQRGLALLYPPDASAWTEPVDARWLRDHQPLPAVDVGGVVDVLLDDETSDATTSDGEVPRVRLRTDGTPTTTQFREYVESPPGPPLGMAKGGDVVAHPAHTGSLSPYAWRMEPGTVASSAHARFTSWLSEGRSGRRRAFVGFLLLVLFLGAWFTLRLLGVLDGARGTYRYGGYGAALLAAWATYRRMDHRVEMGTARGEVDLEDGPSTVLDARLWWAIGTDRPVTAWVAVDPPDADGWLGAPFLGVDPELDLPHDGRVTVHGVVEDGSTVVLRFDDPDDGRQRLLEPADRLRPVDPPRIA